MSPFRRPGSFGLDHLDGPFTYDPDSSFATDFSPFQFQSPVIDPTTPPSSPHDGGGKAIDPLAQSSHAQHDSGATATHDVGSADLGGTSPNDGGHASVDTAGTATLTFDETAGGSITVVSALAITGVTAGITFTAGATITDFAGNFVIVAAAFDGPGVPTSVVTANPDTNHVTASQTVTTDAAHGVLANDTDSNPADHLVVSAVDGLAADVDQSVAGIYGALTMNADGSYTYIASGLVLGVGTDNFTYTTDDGHGQTSTSTLAITVTGPSLSLYSQVPPGTSATAGYANATLDGSAGDVTLNASPMPNAHQFLIGGSGDTLNAASLGQDTFVFANNFGHNTINNFQPATDIIQLQQSQFGSIASVLADIQQVGADSVLTLDANHVITITNTQHASLIASDFHLV